jgi:hypothetical protein
MFKLARFVAHTWSDASRWRPVYTSHGPAWPYILNHADVLWWRSHYLNLLTGYNEVCVYSFWTFNDQLLCHTTLWKGIRTCTTSALHAKELSSEFARMVASTFTTTRTHWTILPLLSTDNYILFLVMVLRASCFLFCWDNQAPNFTTHWWDHWASAVHPFWQDANQEFTPGREW